MMISYQELVRTFPSSMIESIKRLWNGCLLEDRFKLFVFVAISILYFATFVMIPILAYFIFILVKSSRSLSDY